MPRNYREFREVAKGYCPGVKLLRRRVAFEDWVWMADMAVEGRGSPRGRFGRELLAMLLEQGRLSRMDRRLAKIVLEHTVER